MSAPDLHPVLLHHVVNTLGWSDLRPMQRDAIGPVSSGTDTLLLAPTAGGKTEAAMFPLLSTMATERWTGTTILYLCPLKALLNNLLPRLETYSAWLGRRVALWHGDVSRPRRQRIIADPPDILLTTPSRWNRYSSAPRSTMTACSRACARSWWTRCTRSPATTAAGT